MDLLMIYNSKATIYNQKNKPLQVRTPTIRSEN